MDLPIIFYEENLGMTTLKNINYHVLVKGKLYDINYLLTSLFQRTGSFFVSRGVANIQCK